VADVTAFDDVAARLAAVRARIGSTGRDPLGVRIVAVTKGFPGTAVEAALSCGLEDIGENYAQELVAKAPATRGPVRWHFIGRIQTNKVRRLAPLVSLWQGVDRVEAGQAIARHQPGGAVLVEVNVAGDPAKGGCRPADTAGLVDALRELGLDVRGLMTVAAAGPGAEPDAAAAEFARLAALGRRLGLTELSMGMSGDREAAVREGATMVRLGQALFGPRPRRPDLQR
jgi:pyridoxal phosphate enzyme (YggS family)